MIGALAQAIASKLPEGHCAGTSVFQNDPVPYFEEGPLHSFQNRPHSTLCKTKPTCTERCPRLNPSKPTKNPQPPPHPLEALAWFLRPKFRVTASEARRCTARCARKARERCQLRTPSAVFLRPKGRGLASAEKEGRAKRGPPMGGVDSLVVSTYIPRRVAG